MKMAVYIKEYHRGNTTIYTYIDHCIKDYQHGSPTLYKIDGSRVLDYNHGGQVLLQIDGKYIKSHIKAVINRVDQ